STLRGALERVLVHLVHCELAVDRGELGDLALARLVERPAPVPVAAEDLDARLVLGGEDGLAERRGAPGVCEPLASVVRLGAVGEDLYQDDGVDDRLAILRIGLEAATDDAEIGVSAEARGEHPDAQLRHEGPAPLAVELETERAGDLGGEARVG